MKSSVYLNSAFLLRAAIGFSRHLTSAGEDSYSFNLYSIACRILCTYFVLIRGFRFFSQKTSASTSLLLPVSSKNEGNLEDMRSSTVPTPGLNLTRHQLDTVHIHPDSISRTLTKAALPAKMRIAAVDLRGLRCGARRCKMMT